MVTNPRYAFSFASFTPTGCFRRNTPTDIGTLTNNNNPGYANFISFIPTGHIRRYKPRHSPPAGYYHGIFVFAYVF